ncbi:unnamed protein product [Diabrotica balteata]|uniref:tRNA selenocysteine-associated protein 1 n=1 Tax=Diabrotica balteata TaxID=107213 RepID=A0A9N9X6E0_DIABA|nr:unnamed protein product [Diabrotica balteata]
MANSMVNCQLWMGSLESYMTETFILNAFRKMGENPVSVRIIRKKLTGESAGYCFVHFASDEEAMDAMHKLNSKPIPNTHPKVRFRLNNAGRTLIDREFSVWVGDLSSDVDDYNLYRIFSGQYKTIKTAKVILDVSGFSKGYGFVKFGSEEEMKHSLIYMNGFNGLGTKPLKICNAVPKPKGLFLPGIPGPSNQNDSNDFSQYYDPTTYFQNCASWQPGSVYDQSSEHQAACENSNNSERKEDDLDLIEHTIPLDIDKMNREKMDADCNLWDALESSKWLPYEMLEVA